jgi:proline dehydrogenase
MWKPLKTVAYSLASRAAQSYTAPSLQDARRICFKLRAVGLGTTVSFWNDDFDSVESVTHSNLQLLELLRYLDPHSYLSVKLPALQFDSEAVGTVLKAAARMPRLVHFDSHGPEDGDRMFAAIENAFRHNRHLGCTIPGRWLRSVEDARIAGEWGLRVRVVKGQWTDPRDPEMDMRSGFLKVIDALRGRAACVAVASHDVPLAREALRRLMDAGTRCELELLHGLPRREAVRMAQQLEVPVRVYVPQGKAWLPYVLRQAKKNPWVLSWFARDLVRSFGG